MAVPVTKSDAAELRNTAIPALLTRISIRPSSRLTRSTISATAALSVTSAVTDIALAPFCLSSATAAFDFASLRPTMTISAPASANPRAIPRPMPPLPPVTIATLPLRSNSPAFIVDGPDESSALALPDQDQAESGQRRAVAGPLDLVDHEARLRPGDRTGALADPEQPESEGEKANDQKPFAHGSFLARGRACRAIRQPRPEWRARSPRARAGIRDSDLNRCGHRRGTKKPRTMPGL